MVDTATSLFIRHPTKLVMFAHNSLRLGLIFLGQIGMQLGDFVVERFRLNAEFADRLN